MPTKPTPIRRRVDGRSKRVKLAAVMAAEMSGVIQAERQTGIPESTIRYWASQPEFAQYRAKTREDLQEEITLVSHLAWKHVARALADGTMEPRDALFAAEKATGLSLLMSGEPTARTENKSITDGLDDHERQALNDAILGELGRRSDARSVEPAVGAPVEEGSEAT